MKQALWICLLCFTCLVSCQAKQNTRHHLLLLEAKRAEIVFTTEDKSEGELVLKFISPSVAKLSKTSERLVSHCSILDLIDEWYCTSKNKKETTTHGGFIFFEPQHNHTISDMALHLSSPRYDADEQSLTFTVKFSPSGDLLQQSVIQGARLYIDR